MSIPTLTPTGGTRISRRDRAAASVRLRRLDRRLDRSWRRAVDDRDDRVLAGLRDRTGDAIVAVTARAGLPFTTASGHALVVAELSFGDGSGIRLGPCHSPAVAALAAAMRTGRPVELARVRRCERLWVLDFTGPERLSLLGWSVSHHGGGLRALTAVP